ncbi:MAG: PP2C family protein-serine/threonine phosphatase [Gemmatimonadaceae bacterium]
MPIGAVTSGSHSNPTPTDPIVPPGAVTIQTYAQTDVGKTREHNEDAFVVADLATARPLTFDRLRRQRSGPMGTLFMVADGMGGAAAGEYASAAAVEVVLRYLRDHWSARDRPTAETFVVAMYRAAIRANDELHMIQKERRDLEGMGTTATIAGLLGDSLYLAQVGDSRAYLVRGGKAVQITRDQSLMQRLIDAGEISEEAAAQSDRRNIILQALGPEPHVKIDLTYQRLRRGDVLVVCSDGLTGQVKQEDIASCIGDGTDLKRACGELIELANSAGGPDNITVVAARFDGDGLAAASDDDEAGYHEFSLPTQVTLDLSAAGPPPEAPPTPLQIEVDDERRRRGQRWMRILAAIGIVLALYVLWRYLRAP